MTAPQLALLENVMARMERVDVWILMNGGGGGVNPFQARNLSLRQSVAWIADTEVYTTPMSAHCLAIATAEHGTQVQGWVCLQAGG